MNKNILFPHEISLLALRKAENVSRKILRELKHQAQEIISDGGITALGRQCKYLIKKSPAVLALFKTEATILALHVAHDIQQTFQRDEAIRLAQFKRAAADQNTDNIANDNSSLTREFETVGVSEEVYDALHNEVTEFKSDLASIAQQTLEAIDSTFTGPLTAEFEAVRQGKQVFPLKCEFEAYSKLKEHGIEYIREDDTYIFPQEMVTSLRNKFGDTTRQQDANHFVVTFKETADPKCTAPHHDQILQEITERAMDSLRSLIPHAKGGFDPAPAYVHI